MKHVCMYVRMCMYEDGGIVVDLVTHLDPTHIFNVCCVLRMLQDSISKNCMYDHTTYVRISMYPLLLRT